MMSLSWRRRRNVRFPPFGGRSASSGAFGGAGRIVVVSADLFVAEMDRADFVSKGEIDAVGGVCGRLGDFGGKGIEVEIVGVVDFVASGG